MLLANLGPDDVLLSLRLLRRIIHGVEHHDPLRLRVLDEFVELVGCAEHAARVDMPE